jgi:hypothetical protein
LQRVAEEVQVEMVKQVRAMVLEEMEVLDLATYYEQALKKDEAAVVLVVVILLAGRPPMVVVIYRVEQQIPAVVVRATKKMAALVS